MKTKVRGKILAILMSLAMVFTMMPWAGADKAYAAAGDPAICFVTDGNAPNIAGGKGGTEEGGVYFGNYRQGRYTTDKDPVKWRVLQNADKKLFLLSDKNLESQQYHSSLEPITWEGSSIRNWLNNSFLDTAFTDEERAEVATTYIRNKKTDDYTPNPDHPEMDGGNDTDDKVFLLSISDVNNSSYGFTTYDSTREAENTDYVKYVRAGKSISDRGYWWLRSPGEIDRTATYVGSGGGIGSRGVFVDYEDYVSGNYVARPALNLNLGSMIFTSSAVGGKSSGNVGAGSLKQVETNTTDEWKLTLKSGHDDFNVSWVQTCDGKTLNFIYSGAVAKKGEYISAIITNGDISDPNTRIKYYGNLVEFADGDKAFGTAHVTIDGKMESGDLLYVFNEQVNGDKKTDYSSTLKKITIPSPVGHNWSEDWSHNENKHWHGCSVCLEKKDEANHTWSTVCSADDGKHWQVCTVCGAKNEEAHTWSTEWNEDGNNHWHECTVCGMKKDEAAHSWSAEWSADEDKHWHECTVCGVKKDEAAHNCSAEWSTDGDDHWHECTVCSVKTDEEAHSGGTATCKEKAQCEKCNEEYGEFGEHSYGSWAEFDVNQHQKVCELDKSHGIKENHKWDSGKVTKKATTTTTGVKTFTCTLCKGKKTETIPKLAKKANPLTIKAKNATVKGSTKGKDGKLKKTKTLAVTKVIAFAKKGQGKMTYTKASGNKKITINKTTGKVTVKKGLKKGTYKVKVKVKAAGNANYKASAWKTVTFTLKVK